MPGRKEWKWISLTLFPEGQSIASELYKFSREAYWFIVQIRISPQTKDFVVNIRGIKPIIYLIISNPRIIFHLFSSLFFLSTVSTIDHVTNIYMYGSRKENKKKRKQKKIKKRKHCPGLRSIFQRTAQYVLW